MFIYNGAMETENYQGLEGREFRPELLSRRGEYVAWGSSLAAIATWSILLMRGDRIHPALIFLSCFVLLSAMALSLGNWVDRNTSMHIDEHGIEFNNRLRHVNLRWDQIDQVQVDPSRMGKKVRVIGSQGHFDFRTLAEIRSMGKVKGAMGFAEGEKILAYMLQKSGLRVVQRSESGEVYTRK